MLGLVMHWAWFLLAVLVFTAGEILASPQQMSFVADWAPPEARGRYLSLYQATWSIAFAVNPAIALPLHAALGERAFWGLMPLVAIPGVVVLLRLDRTADRPERTARACRREPLRSRASGGSSLRLARGIAGPRDRASARTSMRRHERLALPPRARPDGARGADPRGRRLRPRHVASLAEQPSFDLDGVEALRASFREPSPRRAGLSPASSSASARDREELQHRRPRLPRLHPRRGRLRLGARRLHRHGHEPVRGRDRGGAGPRADRGDGRRAGCAR